MLGHDPTSKPEPWAWAWEETWAYALGLPRPAFFLPCWESAGLGASDPFFPGTITNADPRPWQSGGLDFASGGSEYVDIPYPNDAPFLGALTLLWRGVIRTGGNFRHFCGKHASNGATQNPFDYRTDNSSTPLLTLVRGDNGGAISAFTGPAVTLGAVRSYAVAVGPLMSSSGTFYVDGIATAASKSGGGSGNNNAPTGSGADIRIGRRADGAVQMDGRCDYVLVLSQQMTATFFQLLCALPFAYHARYSPVPLAFGFSPPQTMSPAVASAAWAANAPTLTPGADTLSPTVATAQWSGAAPGLQAGAVSSSPVAATASWLANAVSYSADVTLSPLVATAQWLANDVLIQAIRGSALGAWIRRRRR